MATITSIYKGDLRTEMTHDQSGTTILADAPVDNHGKGQAFSPTDLVAAALGGCMLTIMGIAANRHGFDITGTRVETSKVMTSDPRRIGEIAIDFHFPHDYDDKTRRIIELAARGCPVARSLSPEVLQTLRFHYGK
ncbi:redox protein [Bacteroidia bacterium]|nr:redox protein [Bacteroidia bacterium]